MQSILAAHDRLQPGLEQYIASVAEDIVLMPSGAKAIEGKAAFVFKRAPDGKLLVWQIIFNDSPR